MRVLQVGSGLYDWGGIERYVFYLTDGLRARGHRVEATMPPGSPLSERIQNGQVLLESRGKHDFRALATYLKLFRQTRYDVVHVHFNPDFLAAGIAARLRKQPLTILTRHVALPWSRNKVRLYGSLFDHVIPVSDIVKKNLLASGFPESRMTVAKAGCPALEASLVDRPDGDLFRVGSFGRLVKEKGVDVLLEAARQLPEVEFHVYGSGPMEAKLKEAARPNVHMEGFRSDVADCMAGMDAVAIPSVWVEAFPYAALEAMSLGRPVVASRVGGLPEIVAEGVNGLLFEAGNAGELATSIRRLAADRSAAAQMGLAGQRLHKADYTVERMAERIEAVYQARSGIV
jgi:glycosyltransferase involved in cell wall biosynthesis